MTAAFLTLEVIALIVFVGGGLVVGFVFRWWGLIVPVAFASFLIYAWEFDPLGITYALIGGITACLAVAAGTLARGKVRRNRRRKRDDDP
jgi:hypothetical protein